MKLVLTSFLVVLLYQLTFVESLRCAVECPFVAFPLNVTIPYNACKHEDRDNAQCSVVVEIDFKNRLMSGELYMQKLTSTISLRTETKFQLETNSVVSTIWYTCTISNDCDYDFLQELVTNKLAEFNETIIQKKLMDLLYTSTPDPTGIECVNGSCSSDQFCQAEFGNLYISNYNYTSINGSLPCTKFSSNDNFLNITQNYFPMKIEATAMFIRCNTKECNNNQTVEEVYRIMSNDFILPINYSILDMNISVLTTTTTKPLPSAGSFLYSFHGLIIFISMFLFFYLK